MLILYFLFQLLIYGIGLLVSRGPLSADTSINSLFVVIPVEVYLFVAGFRVGTARGFLIVFFVGCLSLSVKLWFFEAALRHVRLEEALLSRDDNFPQAVCDEDNGPRRCLPEPLSAAKYRFQDVFYI